MMNSILKPKILLVVLILAMAVSSLPLPKSRRRRKPNSGKASRLNLLKVYNFSVHHTQLITPTNSRKYFLWSRNGRVYLQANRNLTPGTNNTKGPRAEFKGEVMTTGVVRLKNTATKRYLAINQRGRLILQRRPNHDCLFREVIEENGFHTFASYKYYRKSPFDIFIGVKLNGHIKSPLTTTTGQKAVMFNAL